MNRSAKRYIRCTEILYPTNASLEYGRDTRVRDQLFSLPLLVLSPIMPLGSHYLCRCYSGRCPLCGTVWVGELSFLQVSRRTAIKLSSLLDLESFIHPFRQVRIPSSQPLSLLASHLPLSKSINSPIKPPKPLFTVNQAFSLTHPVMTVYSNKFGIFSYKFFR